MPARPSGKPGPKSGRSPHKRVADWIKDAADRAETGDKPEPILDAENREEAGRKHKSSLVEVKAARARASIVTALAPELPQLNPRHLAFVEAIVTGEAANATEAYAIAYGSKIKRDSMRQHASTLASDHRTQEWLAAYRMAALDDVMTTVDRHVAQLARIRELAIAKGDLKAAGIAEVSRGKVAGLYHEHLVVEHRANDSQLLDALTKAVGAEQAAALAHAMGVRALPGDKARAVVIDHATGDSEGTVDAVEAEEDEG